MFEHPHPPDWTTTPVYSLANWQNGLAFRNIHFAPTGRPVIKIAELKGGITAQTRFTEDGFDDAVRVLPGDMLFSWSGNPETSIDVFLWDGPEGWLNQHIFKATPREGVNRRFLYYLLKFLKPSFTRIASDKQTTGLGHVTVRDLKAMTVGLPSPAEQEAIVEALSPLDDKIDLNRRLNADLEAMAQAVFQSWFVDFDPVRAKAAGRQPEGLAPEIAALFPDQLVHTEFGEIPAGWENGSLSNISDLNQRTLSSKDPLARLEYVEISEVRRGNILAIKSFQRGEEPSRAKRRIRHGDTVISTVRPERESYFLALNPPLNRIVSTGFAVLTPKSENWAFLHVASTMPCVFEELGRLADGGAYPAVRPDVILGVPVFLPSPVLIEKFHFTAAPLFERAAAARLESEDIEHIINNILPDLVCGRIRIAELQDRQEGESQ